MLNRGTVLLLVSAIALGGGVLLLTSRDASRSLSDGGLSETLDESQGDLIFSFAEEDIERFSLTRTTEADESEVLSFNKDESDFWQMSQPETGEAEGGAIAFLLSQLTATSTSTLTAQPDALKEFGLADPIATIALQANGQDYLVNVGGADFTGSQRYITATEQAAEATDTDAETDPSATDSDSKTDNADESEPMTIHVVSASIVNAVNRPTADWLVSESASEESSEADSVDDSDSEPASNSEAESTE